MIEKPHINVFMQPLLRLKSFMMMDVLTLLLWGEKDNPGELDVYEHHYIHFPAFMHMEISLKSPKV